MSHYQWVLESPEDADGVSTTIVLGFDDTDSDDAGEQTHTRSRQRHESHTSGPSSSGMTRSQLQRHQDESQLMWWSGSNGGGGASGGRSARSDGGSSRRSKGSSARRSRRGQGSSAGASSHNTSFGQYNGNGRRGGARSTTPIFTSTYFPDTGAEAQTDDTHLAQDSTASPSFTYRSPGLAAQPSTAVVGRYATAAGGRGRGSTRTSGSSRSSGGSGGSGGGGVFALAPVEEEDEENGAYEVYELCEAPGLGVMPPPVRAPFSRAAARSAGQSLHPHQLPQNYTAVSTHHVDTFSPSSDVPFQQACSPSSLVPSRRAAATAESASYSKKLQKKLSRQPFSLASEEGEATSGGGGLRQGRTRRTRASSALVPMTITTMSFADQSTSSDDEDIGDAEEDDNDDEEALMTAHVLLHANSPHEEGLYDELQTDFGRYQGRAAGKNDFATTVASLASQAHQLRHHLEPVHTPPLAPAKPTESPAARPLGTSKKSHASASAAASGRMPPPEPSRSMFSSQRPQSQAQAVPAVSSFYISPIHQSVAQETSDWAGTPYFFLGEGGGVSSGAPKRSSASGLSRKELREREAALEAEHSFDLAVLEAHGSGSDSLMRDDDTYDTSVEEMLLEARGGATTTPGQRFHLAASSRLQDTSLNNTSRGAQRGANAAMTEPAPTMSRKRARGGGGGGHPALARGGDDEGLCTSSDEDEADEIRRRVKRRRLQMIGTEDCGGSKVLGPAAEPVVMPPDMSLQLPTSRAETREDLMQSFFMGQALHEDDFRLY